jgi:hypothetical protein
MPEVAFRSDIAVFDIGQIFRSDPGRALEARGLSPNVILSSRSHQASCGFPLMIFILSTRLRSRCGLAPGCRLRVKLRRTQYEHMFSALPSNSDIARSSRHVSKVPLSDLARLVPLEPPWTLRSAPKRGPPSTKGERAYIMSELPGLQPFTLHVTGPLSSISWLPPASVTICPL